MSLDDALRQAVAEAVEPLARRIDKLADPAARPLAVSAQHAADLLELDDATVRRWVAAGLLPRVPHVRSLRIPFTALEAFVESGASVPEPVPAQRSA